LAFEPDPQAYFMFVKLSSETLVVLGALGTIPMASAK